MRTRTASKILSLLLTACMLFSLLPASVFAADDAATWTRTTLDKITSEDIVAITMTSEDGATTWALPADAASNAPTAVVVTANGDTLTTESASRFGWKFTQETDGYKISCNNGILYTNAANNGVRVGTDSSSGNVWSLQSGYLAATDSKDEIRYLGVYVTNPDWRAYTNTTGNTKGQTLNLWKLTSASEEPEEPTPEEPSISTIADALKGSANAEFTVKGVVTLVDGKNIYVQDGTGGICLYFSAAPSDISLGDTVIGTGKRADYKGLPELSGASYEKSEGLTLAAKETTLGAITEADLCTYVTIKNLTVKKINGKNTVVEDADGNTLPIYNAVVSDPLAAGDRIHFTGAVGTYSGLQLRNTEASEIVKFADEPEESEDTVLVKLTEVPAPGDTVVIFNPGSSVVMSVTDYYYNNKKHELAPVSVTVEDDKLTVTDETIALLTVERDENGQYSFVNQDGKYLEVDGTHAQFVDKATDNTLFVLEIAEGGYYIRCATAAYNGKPQYLQYYYNYFTCYSMNTGYPERYVFNFFGEEKEPAAGLVTDLEQLTDGASVVIYNPGFEKAMSSEVLGSDWYLKPADVTIEDDKAIDPADELVWTVKATDGVYVFEQGDKAVTAWLSGNYQELTSNRDVAGGDSDWEISLCNDETHTYYLKSRTLSNSYGDLYIEVFNKKVNGETQLTFCSYATSPDKLTEKNFGMQFYLVDTVEESEEPEEPEEPEENNYGLSSTLATGDKVILLNTDARMGVSSTPLASSDYYLTGVELTPADGVITTGDATVVWDVTANSDGTYTFTQGDKVLGGTQTTGANGKIYNNFVLTDPAASKWTLEEANDGCYLYLGDLPSSKNGGHIYLEWYARYSEFSLYDYASPGTNAAFIFTFYKQGAEPETPVDKGDLITNLDELDGKTVAIYSPGHMTAISSKPNGDWYLKAKNATLENGKVVNFTSDFVWLARKNEDGTFSFYANDDESRSITVWPSGTYAELSLNVATYPDNTWTLTTAKTADCFYANSPTVSGSNGPAYIEAYIRNEFEVFSGYFTTTTSSRFTEKDFALQFYLVDPDDAIEAYDDGTWDGVMSKGGQYVAYNASAESSLGLFKEANYALDAIPTTIEDGNAVPGNGAYVFTVDTMGRYYSFAVDGRYLATNNDEELFFVDKDEEGRVPENAKWFLVKKDGGYIIYNKDAAYNGTPVCIEYYSSVFSGWTYSTKNDIAIYLFNFYPVAEGTKIYKDIVQAPSVVFDCENSRYVEQDYVLSFSLDDLADEITGLEITYTAGSRTGTLEQGADGKSYSVTIPAEGIDANEVPTSFTITVKVKNSYGIEYEGVKEVEIIDKPFFADLTPAPNTQTKDDKRPVISVKVGNAGEDPTLTMTVNDKTVEAVFENGILSYTPVEDMADGRVTVFVKAVRADGAEAEKSWSFIVGSSEYQLYFGQLHSHTTYSDGSGDLDVALDYIASLPESANVQFVAFTDHSNYFDTTSAANPAGALNDKNLMTEASRKLWNTYKSTVASFNEKHSDLIAVAGFEMTWSGGPGHINTFDSDGLVSRNNAELNNKSGDAGMKLYYETINQGESLSQFNHPGSTFGNFTDFGYWDGETDAHIFLVEVGNGEGQIGAGGYFPSFEQYTLALDKGWHVAPTNNQDNHKGRWGNANDARDVILTNDFSEQGIYDAIRALRVYATEDKNLQITYTVNGEPMGTIFGEENAPEKLNVEITLYDPDASDSVAKVELIVNGGEVAYTWDKAEELAEGALSAELDSEYSYYYVRVTQKDGDLAVTSPVWVGSAVKAGITEIKAETEPVYKGEEATLITTLYNNEELGATVKSLVYSVGGEVIGTDTTGYDLSAGGTLDVSFKHTFDTAKLTTVTVTAIVTIDGRDYTFTANVELDVLDRETENTVTSIAGVRAASDPDDTGYRFIIEGVLTSNASGYDKDTAFFDCIYVQDDTAGICCFPVSGEYKIGDKVRIVGHTDFYQGEPELQVQTIEVIGSGSVTPTEITAAELNNRSAEGKLITISGTVDSFELANGLIQTIMVKDEAGNLARVFIDGYITTAKDVENCAVGAKITVTGLASYDDTFNAPDGPFPRIRIRDRADVVCEAGAGQITLNPGEEDETVVQLNEDGTVPTLPTPEDRDGYIFGGWFDAREGGNQVNEGDTLAPGVTELFAHWYELRVTFLDDVTVPDALTGTYASADAMKDAMMEALLASLNGRTLKGSAYAEMVVEYNKEGQWLPLPANLFPAKGVSATMPYPSGTGKSDTFAVLHLFGVDCNGHKAGENEIPAVTNTDEGISFTVNGTSPVLVGQVDDASDSANTGDNANLTAWALLMVLSATGIAAVVVFTARKKGRREM